MRFCNECGQGNPDDAAFCVQCGTTLTGQQGGPDTGEAPPEGTAGVPAPPPVGAEPESAGTEPGTPSPPVGEEGGEAAGGEGGPAPPPGVPSGPPPPPGVPRVQAGTPPPPPDVGQPYTPGPPPPAYAPGPPGYVPVPHQQTDGMAVAALILGIAGFFFCPLVGVLAVIFGYMGRRNIRESGGRLGGEGFCLAGIILGFIQIGIVVFFGIIWAIIAIIAATHSEAMGAAFICLALMAAT